MNLLVDTHVFLWLLNSSPDITQRQIDIVNDAGTTVFLSAVSIFEIATKSRIGKLTLPPRYQNGLSAVFEEYEYVPLPLQPTHADLAGRLLGLHLGLHKDPFDRLLAAQAIVEDMTLLTIDARIADLGAKVVW